MSDILNQNVAALNLADYVKNNVEESSYKISNIPLGKPVYINNELRQKKHGTPTVSSESIGSLMKAKTADRTPEIHEQYKKSHNSYGISEKINRNYSGFDCEKIYGESTEHDKLGKRIKEALTIDERQVDSEKVSKFNNRTKPKLGQVHDPIIDSFNAKPGQAFGYIELPDNFDAKYLVHDRSGEVFKESKQYTEGITARVRHKLNRSGWNRFDTLKQNFAFFDGGETYSLPADAILMILQRTGFPIDDDSVSTIMINCTDNDGNVDYLSFLNLIDYRPDAKREKISNQNDGAIDHLNTARSNYATNYATHDAHVNKIPTKNFETRGVPTVRGDLPIPAIRRVSDNINYGNEGTTSILISPSIAEAHGVHEDDFFQKRTKYEIEEIFKKMNLDLSNFDAIWDSAQDVNCEASIYEVRQLLQ